MTLAESLTEKHFKHERNCMKHGNDICPANCIAAINEALERAAQECEKCSDEVLARQTGKSGEMNESIDRGLRMLTCMLPEAASRIRALKGEAND